MRLVRDDVTGEGEANERRPGRRGLPAIDTHERRRRDAVSRFLERFAHRGVHQRFASLQMTRRLIEADAVTRLFLDQQECAVVDDDRRDGHGRAGQPGFHAWRRSVHCVRPDGKKAGSRPCLPVRRAKPALARLRPGAPTSSVRQPCQQRLAPAQQRGHRLGRRRRRSSSGRSSLVSRRLLVGGLLVSSGLLVGSSLVRRRLLVGSLLVGSGLLVGSLLVRAAFLSAAALSEAAFLSPRHPWPARPSRGLRPLAGSGRRGGCRGRHRLGGRRSSCRGGRLGGGSGGNCGGDHCNDKLAHLRFLSGWFGWDVLQKISTKPLNFKHFLLVLQPEFLLSGDRSRAIAAVNGLPPFGAVDIRARIADRHRQAPRIFVRELAAPGRRRRRKRSAAKAAPERR